jgi:uncharacterized membrane protein
MRQKLNYLAIASLCFQYWITVRALFGSARLPERIPVHFDGMGNPNGWGSSQSLPLLPLIAIGVYLLLTMVSRFPAYFNYPVKVTEENRERLQSLTIEMLAWVRLEVVLLFTAIQSISVFAAYHPQGGVSQWLAAPVPVLIAMLAATLIRYIFVMNAV